MKPAIEIQSLSKEYTLASSQRYVALRDVLAGSVKNIFNPSHRKKEKFWALENINLSINPGERVGIIGRNGAGKSTLLKIISRITPPTTGQVTIRGRVGSLLEVGTGFHPELTGRENIYLNGSILGLKRKEIDQQLEAIIDFSGVEKFIDTPLKRFSSGMQLRLAFAVAAHLEPEILLIDEVLAVGDLEFQQKCIGKMEEVSREHGRTILFVSHNMEYINSLCTKGVLLQNGKIVSTGTSADTVAAYIGSIGFQNKQLPDGHTRSSIVKLLQVSVKTGSGVEEKSFFTTDSITIEMEYEVLTAGRIIWLGHKIHNDKGVNIFDTHSVNTPFYQKPHPTGKYKATVQIPGNLLNTGSYFVSSALFNHQEKLIHIFEPDTAFFTVSDTFEPETARGSSPGEFPGVVRPLLNWDIESV